MNELKELADRLEQSWMKDAVHYEIVRAEKSNGKWFLTVQEMQEKKSNEESDKA